MASFYISKTGKLTYPCPFPCLSLRRKLFDGICILARTNGIFFSELPFLTRSNLIPRAHWENEIEVRNNSAHARTVQGCPSCNREQTRLSLEYEMSRENRFLRNHTLFSWIIGHIVMLCCWLGLTIRNLEITIFIKLSGNLHKESPTSQNIIQ